MLYMNVKIYYKISLILIFSVFMCSTVFVKDTIDMKVNVIEKKIKKHSKSEVASSDKKAGIFY